MSLLSQLIIYFFYILFFGLFIFWPVVSSNQTGRGFHGLVAQVVLVGAFIIGVVRWISWEGPRLISYFYLGLGLLACLIFALRAKDIKVFDLLRFRLKDQASELAIKENEKRDLADWLIYLTGVSGFLLWGSYNHFFTGEAALYVMSGVFLMGITLYMMALGHFYLVVPNMSEKPLMVASYLFWAALLLKVGLSLWGVIANKEYFMEGSQVGDGFMMNWVFVSMRGLWGFVAAGALSFFSYRLAKMRSFQSATGVLYSMVFFVMVGELISGYFYHRFGVPL